MTYKTIDEKKLYHRAFRIINRYRMNETNLSYQAQGYAIDSLGTLPAWLIEDHRKLSAFYGAAYRRRRQLDKRKQKRKRK